MTRTTGVENVTHVKILSSTRNENFRRENQANLFYRGRHKYDVLVNIGRGGETGVCKK